MAVLSLASGVVSFTTPSASFAVSHQAQPRVSMPVMFFGNKQDDEVIPKGWKKVPSQSRKGQFSYQNLKTGQRYDRIPPSLLRGSGQAFYDDEKDTTAKPFWQLGAEERNDGGGGFFKKARETYADKTSSSELEAYYKRGKTTDGYVEDSGFAANGEDLATVGGVYYLAFVPFLLFGIAYLFGSIGSPYGGGGNFR